MNIEVLQRNHIEDCLSGKRSKRTASDILYPRKKQTRHNGSITSFFRSSPSSNENVSTSPPPPPASPSKPAPSPPPPPQAQQQQQVIAPPRLPKLDFNSLTTPKVKAKLKELHLSTSGTRPELERRYNQYFVFVNANIDSSHPVSGEVLRDRLNKWERTFKFRAKDSIDSDADWKNLIAKAKQTKQ
ncbi:RAD18 Postreplication repair E3 ubiquitin-protein ligase RAD18 [Candida maltosa Xu316]